MTELDRFLRGIGLFVVAVIIAQLIVWFASGVSYIFLSL